MSKIKIVVNGAKGRMGSESIKAISSDQELEFLYGSDKEDNLERVIADKKPDVVVDFTLASVGFSNAKLILELGTRAVIGTSGFKDEDVKKLESICADKKLGAIVAPNFAIGAVLMMKFAALAAPYLPNCEIIEFHHDRKEDYPSGTAIKTAELLSSSGAKKFSSQDSRAVYHKGIPIHAIRLPGYVASEEVIFGGLGQTLTIRHDSLTRESFMPGVLLSCKKVVGLDRLVYGLENIL